MESFKSGAGALTIANTVIELGLLGYVVKESSKVSAEINRLSNEMKFISDNMNAVAKRVADNDLKTNHFGSSIAEINKLLNKFSNTQKEIIPSVNELHRFKASTEERLEQIEQYLDIIIRTLEEKEFNIPKPKSKPVSRFSKVEQNDSRKNVSFGKNSLKHFKDEEDENQENIDDNDEDADAMKALKDFRNNRGRR